ncbi:hypothetical protein ACWDA7_38655 [Streptomyces sp. NPDC001156]
MSWPSPPAAADRSVSPAAGLALVTGLFYTNQVLFTVYVLRVHAGDPSFFSRCLPAGWFDLASANPALRTPAARFPAPELLAPSVLRVRACRPSWNSVQDQAGQFASTGGGGGDAAAGLVDSQPGDLAGSGAGRRGRRGRRHGR